MASTIIVPDALLTLLRLIASASLDLHSDALRFSLVITVFIIVSVFVAVVVAVAVAVAAVIVVFLSQCHYYCRRCLYYILSVVLLLSVLSLS